MDPTVARIWQLAEPVAANEGMEIVDIELRPEGLGDGSRGEAEREAWSTLAAVPAVRHGRIHVLEGSEFVVPGPRIAAAAERLAQVVHR